MYCISAIHFYDQTIDAIICSSYILIFKHYIDYHVYQSFLHCELQSIDTTTLALCFVHFLTFLHDWLCLNRPITVFTLFGFPFLPSVISTWQDLNTELYLTFHLHSTYNATVCVWGGAQSFSRVWLFVTPWTVAHQAPLSMGFSRHIYWSGLPFPSPGYLLNLGIKPESLASPAFTGRFFTTSATWEAHDVTGGKQITSLTDLTVNPKGWCCQSAALKCQQIWKTQ